MAAVAAVASLSAGTFANAATISYTGGTYTQDFNALAGTNGNAPALSNGVTIPGFYTYISGKSTFTTAGPIDKYDRNSNGAVTVGTASTTYLTGSVYGLYAYGSASGVNPALGTFDSDSNTTSGSGYVAAGFGLQNNTGSVLTGFTLTYDLGLGPDKNGATLGANNADALNVSYAIGATGVGNADGTYVTAPTLSTSVDASNVVTGPSGTTITGLTINPGDTLFIRFVDTNVSGADHFFLIDNVAIALPEPASLGAFAFGGMGLLARRRKAAHSTR